MVDKVHIMELRDCIIVMVEMSPNFIRVSLLAARSEASLYSIEH
jgi:hypothetical protein